MRRLLHGKALYVALGLLILALYGRTMMHELWEGRERVGSLGAPRLEVLEAPASDTSGLGDFDLDPPRLLEAARRFPALGMMLLLQAVMAAGLGIGGLALSLRAVLTRRLSRAWRAALRPPPRWSLGEVWRIAALALAVAALLPFVRLALLSVWPQWHHELHGWIVAAMLLLDALVILTILAFASHKGRSAWAVLGLSGAAAGRAFTTGFRGYVAAFPWLAGLLVLVATVLESLGYRAPVEPIQELVLAEDRPEVLGLTMVLACLIGPVAEELLFRGVLFPALWHRTSRWTAVWLSSAIFALFHHSVVGFVPIMVLGGVLALVYARTGSLAAPLGVHIFHNTFLMNGALTLRQLLALGSGGG
jgi:membrane protease YdiL (CAAX protease family)